MKDYSFRRDPVRLAYQATDMGPSRGSNALDAGREAMKSCSAHMIFPPLLSALVQLWLP